MSTDAERYVYLATLADWSEIETLLRSTTAETAREQKADLDRLIDQRLAEQKAGRP